jgi:hypothetical protein
MRLIFLSLKKNYFTFFLLTLYYEKIIDYILFILLFKKKK